MAFLLACCFVWPAVNFYKNGYPYRFSLDRAKLEAFCVNLVTPQQYEDWLCPDFLHDSFASNELDMTKMIWLEDKLQRSMHISVNVQVYSDAENAKWSYDNSYKAAESFWPKRGYTSVELNSEYDYYFTKTYREFANDGWFWFLPHTKWYKSRVRVRYKNVIFCFEEYSNQRESRIGEVIDQLWADYEQYKIDNNLT
jgi:hypothetical protein